MYRFFSLPIIFFLSVPLLYSQNYTLSGTVIDSLSGEPFAFVNIVYDNSGKGTVTSIDGNFKVSLKNMPEKLNLSYVGYKPQTLWLTSGLDLKNIRHVHIIEPFWNFT